MILKGQVKKTFKLGDAEIYYKEPSALKITKEVYEFTGKHDESAFKELQKNSQLSMNFSLRLLKKIIVGWKGIKDEDGKDVPFDPELTEDFETDEIEFLMKELIKIINSKTSRKNKGESELKNS